MKTLEQIRRQFRTAEELLDVVKAMKGVAASNIHHYERAVEALDQYSQTLELGFRILIRREPRAMHELQNPDSPRTTTILIGSDQGMVGRFNEEIVEFVGERVDGFKGSSADCIVVGSRLGADLQAAGITARKVIELPSTAEGIIGHVQQILVALNEQLREPFPLILLAHHRPSGKVSYEPQLLELLPVDAGWLRGLEEEPWPYPCIPSFSLSVPRLRSSLIRNYLLVSLERGLAQSLAAENAKRLAAMQAAEKNVTERIVELRAHYHRQRQAEITSELLEVVAGFEVLSTEGQRR